MFRYSELIAIHGELEPLADVDMCPEKRVKVTFTFKDRSEVRSVDVYRTVADLKTKLEPITGLSAARMRLFYVDQDFRHIQVGIVFSFKKNSDFRCTAVIKHFFNK